MDLTNKQPLTFSQQLNQIHKQYFTSPTSSLPPFEQIDHGPSQLCSQLFSIQQNCLVISYSAFEKYYEKLFNLVRNQSENISESLMAANVLLTMNGENDRAWNLKKKYLTKKYNQWEQSLSLDWELTFNAAVCLKCKKSSSYYQYRLKLIDLQMTKLLTTQSKSQSVSQPQQLKNHLSTSQKNYLQNSLQQILQRQNNLITQVLARFFRNYFCWMYRIKLIKLMNQKLSSLQQNFPPSLHKQLFSQQLSNIHKFLSKYCNDYSAYSYLISFTKKYILNDGNEEENKQFLQNELSWVKEIKDYCQVAYQQKQHYRHLLMYQTCLIDLVAKQHHKLNYQHSIIQK